ncbi:MAG TPA: hypothetical protein VIW67_20035, partial [Terriglobales bacterium]
MKIIAALLFISANAPCFASNDTNIIAISDWSKPVGNFDGHTLRVRMIVTYGRGAAFSGPWAETQFYLEFENVSGAIGSPTQFYFDPEKGLNCELKDT